MASRKRVGKFPHHDFLTPLGKLLQQSVEHPVKPVVTQVEAPVQEVIHLASGADFDIRKLLPPTNTGRRRRALHHHGVVLGSDPEKTTSDVNHSPDGFKDKDKIIPARTSCPCRHIGHFHKQFEVLNKPMPITINIGLDPAIAIGTTFEPPTTPISYNELWVAGALRR